jgi:peptide/nickel transport system ATP-binding protein
MKNAAHPPRLPLLRVENLVVHLSTERGNVRAVGGVTLTLKRGRTLGLVGESGCGKSIFCRTLLGLLPPTAVLGEISRIDYKGSMLTGLNEKAYNRIRAMEIAMVFQDPLTSLNPVMTIGRQIAETLVYHKKMKRHAAYETSIELLRSMGVPDPRQRIGQYPHQLSGGMRQRVALAIALACKPELLIADEPTTALDVTVQAEILDLLSRLQRKREMAIILVTHDLHIAAARAHEIAVMYAGQIVEQAPAATLLSQMAMPYTRALTDSIPPLGAKPHTPLNSIKGQPPQLSEPASGCPFAPRCSRVREKCRSQPPPLRPGPQDHHLVACWYPLKGGQL